MTFPHPKPSTLLIPTLIATTGLSVEVRAQQVVLEEVFVTAQRRTENLQEVPISVQAFSSDVLRETSMTNTDFLSEIVPNLVASRQIGGSTPFLRGAGTQNSAMGDEANIALYVDDVYMSSMYANDIMFNNIERVEVLKGPQGTLYGRNATGGLIHIVTRTPSRETSGELGLSYGDYEMLRANLYATTGLGDRVAADIAVAYQDQGEGFGDNLTTGQEVNRSEYTALRSKWLFDLGDEARITLIADYQDRENDLAFARAPAEGALGIDGALIFQGCTGTGAPPDVCQAAAIAGATKAPDNFQDNYAGSLENLGVTEQWGISGKIEYAFDGFDLLSITAYRDVEVDDVLDQDAVAFDVVTAPLPREETAFSQEFRLLSNSDGPLSWIAGLYYLDFDADYSPFRLTGLGLPLLAPGLQSLVLPVSQDTESTAVFGEVAYEVSERLRLTGGVRYTNDEREIEGVTMLTFGFGPLDIPFGDDESWDEPTWRLAADFQATEDLMLYASYARGFKSGVYNSVVTTGVLAPPVDPEILDSWEVGVKSTLAEGRVRLNAALFYYDYEDLQLTATSAGIIRLSNAATAEVYGAEFEFLAALTENLEIRAAAGLLDTEYKNFECVLSQPTGIGGNAQPTGSCDGNELIRSPEYTGNIGATWSVPTEIGSVMASFNWYYNDGFYWEPDNRLEQDSYDLLNAELSWTNRNETLRLRLYGNNLTDSEYSLYGNSGQFGDLVSAAPPRVWGAGIDIFW